MKKYIWAQLFGTVFISPALLAFMSPSSAPAELSEVQAQPQTQKSASSSVKPETPTEKMSVPNQAMQPMDLYPQYGGVALKQNVDIFVTGEFLWWTAFKDIRGSTLKNLTANKSKRIENFYKFDYRPGFRVGIGTVLPNFDNWVLAAEYTWYHHEFTTHDNAHGVQTLNPQTITGTQFVPGITGIQSKVHFHFDEIKAKVGRPFYFGKRVIADVFLGLKGVWSETSLNQKWSPIPIEQRANFRLWSVGSMAGLNGSVLLGAGFSVVTKAEIGFLYARINRKTQEIIAPPGTGLTSFQKYPHAPDLFYAMAEGGMGLEWGHYMFNQKAHVNFGVSYDFLAMYVTDTSPDTVMISASPAFHGITVHGRLDF